MKEEGLSIRRALSLALLLAALSLMIILSGLWVWVEVSQSKRDIAHIEGKSSAEQKSNLQNKVNNVLSLIESIRLNSPTKSDEELQNEILDWLATLRFDYGGYYFVNEVGGQALVYDGERINSPMNLLDMKDPTGLRLFDLEIEAYQNPEGEFMTYQFKRISTSEPELKVSFMKGLHDWEWIIGAGNYVKDISIEIEKAKSELKTNLSKKISKILLVFLVFSLLLILIAHTQAQKVNRQIQILLDYLKDLESATRPPLRNKFIIKELNSLQRKFGQLILSKNKAESEISAALEIAERSSRLKSAFLNNMSHEIRTPLNAIVGFSNLIVDDDIDDDQKLKYVELINTSSDHLLSMLNEVLYLSKLESSEAVQLMSTNFDLRQVLDQVKDLFEPQSNLTGIKIVVELDNQSDSISINTDLNKFIQVLNSLTSNALKFTKEGQIQIGYIADETDHVFFVKDTGIGIPEDDIEHIFDRFYQVEKDFNKQYAGVGLGLSITKKLIGFLGGKIWVESTVGEGSSFFFTIPKI